MTHSFLHEASSAIGHGPADAQRRRWRRVALAALPLLVACSEDSKPEANWEADHWSPAGTTSTASTAADDAFWVSKRPCVSAGAERKSLFRSDDVVDVDSILPDGESLLYTTYQVPEEGRAPGYGLHRISLTSGENRPLASSEVPLGATPIAELQGRFVYLRVVRPPVVVTDPQSATVIDPGERDLVLRDAATGIDTAIPRPPGATDVSSTVVTTDSAIIWVSSRNDNGSWSRSIARWDSKTQATTELVKEQGGAVYIDEGIAANADEVFFTTQDPADPGTSKIEAVRQTDGARRVVIRKTSGPLGILAVDDASIFYRQGLLESVTGKDLMSIAKDGSRDVALATDANVVFGFAMGPSWLYWIDYRDQNTLVRVPRRGGAVERATYSRLITRVAADRCNVYWTTDGQTKIGARAH